MGTKKAENVKVLVKEGKDGYVLYLEDEGGPIITSQTLEEAKEKMKTAFGLSMIANAYWAYIYQNGKQQELNPNSMIKGFKQDLESV